MIVLAVVLGIIAPVVVCYTPAPQWVGRCLGSFLAWGGHNPEWYAIVVAVVAGIVVVPAVHFIHRWTVAAAVRLWIFIGR
ncbi:MAG TPA: hypothetical protein VKT83_06150 [bacterium]|nr:hypothetical protein [bacterium]